MRRFLFALALLSLSAVDAVGEPFTQCLVFDSGSIAKALAAVRRGDIKGQVVEGDAATKMAKQLGFKVAAAVFLIIGNDGSKLAVVVTHFEGHDVACFADTAKAVKLFGEKA
jgi:hypothetical protein